MAPFHIVWDEAMGLLRISANAEEYFLRVPNSSTARSSCSIPMLGS